MNFENNPIFAKKIIQKKLIGGGGYFTPPPPTWNRVKQGINGIGPRLKANHTLPLHKTTSKSHSTVPN